MGEKKKLDFIQVLANEEASLDEFFKLSKDIAESIAFRKEFEKLLEDFSPISRKLSTDNKVKTRKGITYWILGDYEDAIKILEDTRSSKESKFFLGVSYLDIGKINYAVVNLQEAYDVDKEDRLVLAYLIEALIKQGKNEKARDYLEKLERKDKNNPDVYYLWGLYNDFQGNYEEAYDFYERASQLEPDHTKSRFRMAYNLGLWDDESCAEEVYEELKKRKSRDINTMINLAVVYEDRGDYERAKDCLEAVLRFYPNHPRARTYLEDVIASMNMYYDEEEARRKAKLASLLATTIEDLGLSLRVEELIKEHGIVTVGDLIQKTETELRSIENIGKIAMDEIKEALHTRGLTFAHAEGESIPTIETVDEKKAEILKKPLSDFEWPGRLKRVFQKLSIFTVGDLIKKSEKELLANKNLGLTSIKEIKKKLEPLGVLLKQDK